MLKASVLARSPKLRMDKPVQYFDGGHINDPQVLLES